MPITVEKIDDGSYYKVVIEPSEDEDFYIAETSLGTAIVNDFDETYDIEDKEWYKLNNASTMTSKVKIEKRTQLILPTDETLEKEHNGKRCYGVNIEWNGCEFIIGPLTSILVSEKELGDKPFKKMMKGCIVCMKYSSSESLAISNSSSALQYFLKGLEISKMFMDMG